MQKERRKYNQNPYRLHSLIKSASKPARQTLSIQSSRPRERSSKASDRYQGEIAPPSKMKEYQSVADKYKNSLSQENRYMQQQYSEDLKEVKKVEAAVEQIASMMSEFVRVIHLQSDQVEDVYETSEQSVEFVQRSNTQLQATIDRSKSYQWNMILLSFTLAVMLLILDAMTP